MEKKKIYNIEDSNIEGIGTDADKKCRETAAATEKAWKKAKDRIDKGNEGFWAWRIEKFKVKTNQDAIGGTLYDDDSYIFLKAKKNKEGAINMDIHFWLGKSTSQDEAGAAAYKTVELDAYFNDKPIQHREVSGNESALFLTYFDHPPRLLTGGVDSGFNHVEPESYKPRLLWLKGKKHVRSLDVEIKLSNVNSGDVFILDAGLMLYQFQGKKAGKFEKLFAGKLARSIDDERKGKPNIEVFSQTDKPDDNMGIFFSYFAEDCKNLDIEATPGKPVSPDDCIKLLELITDESSDDKEHEKKSDKVLLQVSDADGEMKITEVAKGKNIKKDMLKSDDVFIFDIGMEIYIWIGKGANENEKAKAFHYATQYLKNHGKSLDTPCCSIYEGGENEVFEASFH